MRARPLKCLRRPADTAIKRWGRHSGVGLTVRP